MKKFGNLEILGPDEAPLAIPLSHSAATSPDSRPDTIADYASLVWHHKWIVIGAALFSALVAVLLTLPQTPLYQAQTSLEIQGLNENFMHMNEMRPSAAMYAADGYVQTQVDIIESRSMIRRAALKTNFLARSFEASRKSWIFQFWGSKQAAAKTVLDDKTLDDIDKVLKVRTSPPTRIVRVTFDSPDPHLAADFANALTKGYVTQMAESRLTESRNTVDGLTSQLDDLKVRLRDAEDKLQNYTRSAGLMFLADSKGSVAEQRLKEIQEEYSKAQAERITRQSEFDVAKAGKIESLPRVLDSVGLTDTQQKLATMRTQLAELSQELTPKHYKVQRLQAQIQTMEAELNKGRSSILQRITNETDQAVQRERMLESAYSKQRALVADQNQKALQYDRLKHEADTDRALYDTLSQRVREAGIASGVQTSNVRMIDVAEPPAKPYKPDILLNVSLGAMTGLFIGLAFVCTRENYNRRVRKPGEASRVSNTPELGVVPLNRGAVWERARVTDSVRSMLTSLVFRGASQGGPRVIVITSPGAGEGKTTIVRNLGNALSNVAGRVLLVDADLYRPRLATLFGISNFWGLNNLLHDTFPVAEYPSEALGAQCSDRLWVLPSGPMCDDSSGLLYSDRLGELITRLRNEYDVILIDTPPMMEIPDARVFGRVADGVVLVIRSGETKADALATCTERLLADGTTLLGTVLNGWHSRPTAYNYYRKRRAAAE
jgi:succinoglycan biosynthesis transport protein ExoP